MNYSELIAPLVFVGFLLLLAIPEADIEQECHEIEYKQRARLQIITVCPDTVYDTGTGRRAFQDTIQTIQQSIQ